MPSILYFLTFKSFNIFSTVLLILPLYFLHGSLISKLSIAGLDLRLRKTDWRFDSWDTTGALLTFNGFFVKFKVPDLDSIFTSRSSYPVIGNEFLILPFLPCVSCCLSASIDSPASKNTKVAVTSGEYTLS